jgi:hypothetical protein
MFAESKPSPPVHRVASVASHQKSQWHSIPPDMNLDPEKFGLESSMQQAKILLG